MQLHVLPMLVAKCFAPYSKGGQMSRIGKKPVTLPSGVTASLSGQTIEIKGPKGARSFSAADDVSIAIKED